jgi:dTDP-glucose 4,6-dehydratase
MKLLVTGGAGFIGSTFVRLVLSGEPGVDVVNLDKLTYAGNLDNLSAVLHHPRYRFVPGDICDASTVKRLFADVRPDAIVHFAAETHVDRSLWAPLVAVETNVRGTAILLDAAREIGLERFIHVSTDEVYGSLEPPLEADELFPLNPSSAYSASKAASDLLALAYFKTYRLPVVVTRASNNYGPHQFPEKLIPLMILNALNDQALPIYGDGQQIRDWLFVEDHCRALVAILKNGRAGEIYNIAGHRLLANLEVVRRILTATGRSESLMTRVQDRPGHDRRYALSSEKLFSEIGWTPVVEFDDGLARTIAWYSEHSEWVDCARSGEYRDFYARNYDHRSNELRGLRVDPRRLAGSHAKSVRPDRLVR